MVKRDLFSSLAYKYTGPKNKIYCMLVGVTPKTENSMIQKRNSVITITKILSVLEELEYRN